MSAIPDLHDAWKKWDEAWEKRVNAPMSTSKTMYEFLCKEEQRARRTVAQAHAYHHPEHHEDDCPLLRFRLDQMRHNPGQVT